MLAVLVSWVWLHRLLQRAIVGAVEQERRSFELRGTKF